MTRHSPARSRRSVGVIALLAAACLGAAISAATAGQPLWKLPHVGPRVPDCIGKYCCDDYHRKPLPCPPPKVCLECPDYCGKPLPCVPPVKAFCCDDFCPKPLPPLCCGPIQPLHCAADRLPPTSFKLAVGDKAAAEPAEEVDQSPQASSRRR